MKDPAAVIDFEGAGERYTFLLQPLRDLAKNWEVDISRHLNDYVERLIDQSEEAAFVDDHGRRKM